MFAYVYIVRLWQSRKFGSYYNSVKRMRMKKYSLIRKIELKKQGVCVGKDDVYFNYKTKKNKLMNDFVPW